MTFLVVDPLANAETARRCAPANVVFAGAVTRDRVDDHYRQADLFVFPTLSDGFGLTPLEAVALGLPVIATSRSGEVVTNGEDGFIVPACDAEALAATIARLDDGRISLESMSERARFKARQFSLKRLAERLVILENRLPWAPTTPARLDSLKT